VKKTFLLLLCISCLLNSYGQIGKLFSKKKKDTTTKFTVVKPTVTATTPPAAKIDLKKSDVSKRSADHLMLQFGSDSWLNRPDSVATKGFSRHFNFYFMLDKPLKNDHRFSIGLGAGIGTSNIFFDHRYVDVKANSSKLPFRTSYSGSDSSSFNKSKITTIYLELPIEFRYYSNPSDPNHSWKAAAGIKLGTLLKSYFKGKDLQNKSGGSIYGSSYIEKEYGKRFFNGTKVALTGRVGYGNLSLNVDYQLTEVLQPGFGPKMNTLSIGLTLSGL